jgi:hypothetical protein
MRAVLPGCLKRGTKIISNQGWINPDAAANAWCTGCATSARGREGGGRQRQPDHRPRTRADRPHPGERPSPRPRSPTLISAEAYLGAEPIVQALKEGAQIVITGRVADPSIFMAPMAYEFGWDPLDHLHLGAATAWAICWNAARRSPAATSATPASRTCPSPGTSAFPSPRSTPTATPSHQGGRHRRRHDVADREGADALRGARPRQLPDARRGGGLHHRAAGAGGPRSRARDPTSAASRAPRR